MKKVLAVLLTLTLAISAAIPAFAALLPTDYPDLPTGWSRPYVVAAINDNLIQGDNGKINPKGLLTRAQMAAVLVRAFGAVTKKANMSEYADVDVAAWYYRELSVAVGIGLMQGDLDSFGHKVLRPNDKITRQEVSVVLQRAFHLTEDVIDLTNFDDYADVGMWALGAISALVRDKKMDGYEDNTLKPKRNITREEFVKLLYRIVSRFITEPGVYTLGDVEGSVVVRSPGVTIKDSNINGDIILGDEVAPEDVIIDNTDYIRLVPRNESSEITEPDTPKGEEPGTTGNTPVYAPQPTESQYTFTVTASAYSNGYNISETFVPTPIVHEDGSVTIDYPENHPFIIDLGLVIYEDMVRPYKDLIIGYASELKEGGGNKPGITFVASGMGGGINTKVTMEDVRGKGVLEYRYEDPPFLFIAEAEVTGTPNNYTLTVIKYEAKFAMPPNPKVMKTGSGVGAASLYTALFGAFNYTADAVYLTSTAYVSAVQAWWEEMTAAQRTPYIRVISGGVTVSQLANLGATIYQARNSTFAITGNGLDIEIAVSGNPAQPPVTSLKIADPANPLVPAVAVYSATRGKTYNFSVIVNGGGPAEDVDLLWSVSDTTIAKVINAKTGVIQIQSKIGTATLTARDLNTGISSSIVLRVT